MNISIKRRIYYSFSLLVLLFMISGIVTILTLSSHKRSSAFVSEIIDPSFQSLIALRKMTFESKTYSTNWVYLPKHQNDKNRLIKIHNEDYKGLKIKLEYLSNHWLQKQWADSLHHLLAKFETTLESGKRIMNTLPTVESYNNDVARMKAEAILENELFPKTEAVLGALNNLLSAVQKGQLQESKKLENASLRLQVIILVLAIATMGIGFFLSMYFAKIIVAPIKKIRHIINDLGKGIISVYDHKENNDEIGEMVQSVNSLSKNLWRTATFAHEVGTRNFDTSFEPLSQEDTLGKALVAMRDDLKSGEKELLEANRELNTFFNSIDAIFFSVDMVNLKVIQVSKGCEKLYGYSTSCFLNDHTFWLQLIHPEDKHIIEEEDKLLLRGEQVNNQYRIICNDNTIKWVESKISPTLDETGMLTRVDGITSDITKRKKSEAELRNSEERYRQIVETAREGIWMIDENNITTFVNKKMCEILEYSEHEMIGRTNLSFKDEEEQKRTVQQLERRRKGINETHEARFVTKSGRHIWTQVSTNAIFEDGQYKGALAMFTDITQRKLDEELLKKSEANLRTIFNNTELSYILVNDVHEIVSFNDLATKFSQEQVNKNLAEGAPIINYFPGERQTFVKYVIDKVMKGEPVGYEMSYNKTDGSKKWYEIRWVSVANMEKKNWGFILTSKDITEKRIARLDREKVTADLILRNKDLQQFTYIVSHNLRAPVANIMGISNLLNLTGAEGTVQENQSLLKGLTASVKQLDNIIFDLNDILKVRNPGSELKEKVSFSSLVSDIKLSINHLVDKENAIINFDFSQADHAFTLKTYIYSIFYNLILNSIKYKQPLLSPLIEIKGYRCDKKVHLQFKDNGKGIDMQKNGSDIFMLYKRFDTTVEGKGLGLYMVKTAVETLGGTITLNSEINKGTIFDIELPFLN